MLFNSLEFILIFLPVTLFLFYAFAKHINNNVAKIFLIIASLCFYSYWDISNLPVLLLSIICNYFFGHLISRYKSKKYLVLGVAFNLLLLIFFKYTGFIIENLNIALNTNYKFSDIILPLGISFFTFTQTAYLVDVYRRETASYSKSDYLLFVTIFPHLIAGPILYHKDMIPQFNKDETYRINYENLYNGLLIFIYGLFKKVIIADNIAKLADTVFLKSAQATFLDSWVGSFAYTLQLYFDFSGYSEMAIGLGLMLNMNLPQNFNLPYTSTSIIEFWRRWHMTLSAFLKNYLYIPLGGNRTGHHMRNIMITMLLGGLWHGAGWTFVLWGGMHGLFICINHLWKKTKYSLPKVASWILTINAVNIAWVFFRSENINTALNIIKTMFSLHVANFSMNLLKLNDLIMVICLLILSLETFRRDYFRTLNKYVSATIAAIIFLYILSECGNKSVFLYFQF